MTVAMVHPLSVDAAVVAESKIFAYSDRLNPTNASMAVRMNDMEFNFANLL